MRFTLLPRQTGHFRPPAFPVSRFALYIVAAAALMHLALAA